MVAGELDRLGVPPGPVAVVTAGWQEREPEDRELREHVGRAIVNLELWRRGEEVFAEDRELFEAGRARQDRLRAVQAVYRARLEAANTVAWDLLRREGDPEILQPERDHAIEMLRAIDHHHLSRILETHRTFDDRWHPHHRLAVVRHRIELEHLLRETRALLIAGGHVAVLLNRLRLFGLHDLARELPVVAWSAGAMCLAERVVAFHDDPPQGRGAAEIVELGLSRCRGILPLPHAAKRLRLHDPVRVEVLARRFAPLVPVPLDARDGVLIDGQRWSPLPGTRRLDAGGAAVAFERAGVE